MTCYRITFRDSQHKEHELPAIAESAVKAVLDLRKLGYDVNRVINAFPSV